MTMSMYVCLMMMMMILLLLLMMMALFDESDRDNYYGGNHSYDITKRYNLCSFLNILLSPQPISIYLYLYVYRLNDFLRFSFDLNSDDMEHIPSTLISELKEYVNNDLLSDVSFIVEGKNNDR